MLESYRTRFKVLNALNLKNNWNEYISQECTCCTVGLYQTTLCSQRQTNRSHLQINDLIFLLKVAPRFNKQKPTLFAACSADFSVCSTKL